MYIYIYIYIYTHTHAHLCEIMRWPCNAARFPSLKHGQIRSLFNRAIIQTSSVVSLTHV